MSSKSNSKTPRTRTEASCRGSETLGDAHPGRCPPWDWKIGDSFVIRVIRETLGESGLTAANRARLTALGNFWI